MLIGGINERTKLPWIHNTLFFVFDICQHYQCTSSAISTTYIFSFVILSSFLLKKKHMRKALFFCFNLKKSTAESHRMLVEAYGDNALSETTCRDWFRRFNDDNFDLSDRKHENRLKKIENCCRLFWTRTIPNRKMFTEQLVFFKQPFPYGYMPWGRFKRSENGCRMNWTIGRWSDAKTHAKFCLPDKKESRSCIGLWQVIKSGSIFRILNARNLGLIPSNHQYLPHDQIASDGRRCCAFGGIRKVSATMSCKTWWNS